MTGPRTAAIAPDGSVSARLPIALVCGGCGYRVPDDQAFVARCPVARDGDDMDHVLRRVVDADRSAFPDDAEPATFVRYRTLLRGYHVARAAGWPDERLVELIRRLDEAVALVDGRGFRETPFEPAPAVAARLGLGDEAVWIKDETGNVAGSHKARHLMGAMLELQIDQGLRAGERQRPGEGPRPEGRPDRLAIASCGNAALAAAVVARAAGHPLDVFVPTWADASVVERLARLGAAVVTCPRAPGETGDPTYRRLREAVAAGAIPFTCQGDLNGLAIEGGETLGYEMVTRLAGLGSSRREPTAPRGRTGLDTLVVQVGGGALASAVAAAFAEASALGVVDREPRLYAVQTEGCAPLARAWGRLRERAATDGLTVALDHARRHRSAYMWPWETEPTSLAHGILDDETYDWLAVVEAVARTGGDVVVVDEATVEEANAVARATTDIAADHTGTAGLAGLLALRRSEAIRPDESVAILFTGGRRDGGPGVAPDRPATGITEPGERSA